MAFVSLKRFGRSIRDAGKGIAFVFKTEQNFRIQTMMAVLVLVLSFVFSLRAWEIILIILLVMMVMTMEMLNTAVEKFADLLMPRLHHYIYVIKDVMAGAVLLTSLGSAVVGVMIFWPHFINLWK